MTISLRASVLAFSLSAAAAAQAQSIEYRIVERFDDSFVGLGDLPPTAGPGDAGNGDDRTLWLVIQARVSGLSGGPGDFSVRGLRGFGGLVTVAPFAPGGESGGSFKAAGMAGTGGNPTNNSPSTFYPADGAGNPGFGTGVALYPPFRFASDLGAAGDGTRPSTNASSLFDIVGATGGDALSRLTNGELDNSFWGVNTWVNVYAFQYDVTDLTSRVLTFQTEFEGSTYFTMVDAQGVPNSLAFQSETQGTYAVHVTDIPTPGVVALLGLGGLVAARRRRV